MSADNWAVCPLCQDRRCDALLDLEGQLREAYGTLPLAHYEVIRHRYEKAKVTIAEGPTRDMMTFREDWEIGLIEGTTEVFIRYGGHCSVCGAGAKYSTTIDVKPDGE